MNFETLAYNMYNLNEDEEFYRNYYYAKQQPYSLEKFLSTLDLDWVKQRHLLIPEIPSTISERFEDYFFFGSEPTASILTLRHNRYSPAIDHSHTFFELLYVYDGTCKHTIDNHAVSLTTGDICIIPPGITHSVYVFDNSIVFNCIIRKNTLHNIFFNILRNPNILPFSLIIFTPKVVTTILYFIQAMIKKLVKVFYTCIGKL